MLCPLKFSVLADSNVAGIPTNDLCHCEKEKCAWWAESKRVYHTSAEYRSKTGCAIKLIAEK